MVHPAVSLIGVKGYKFFHGAPPSVLTLRLHKMAVESRFHIFIPEAGMELQLC